MECPKHILFAFLQFSILFSKLLYCYNLLHTSHILHEEYLVIFFFEALPHYSQSARLTEMIVHMLHQELFIYCLRSRPVSPNVVRSFVRPSVAMLKIVTE